MSTDPWANTQATSAPAESVDDRLMDNTASDRSIDDRLFGGGSLPSLFIEEHGIGVERAGVIRDIPFEKEAFTFVRGGQGLPKFWENTERGVTTNPVGKDGKPNKRVMDLVIPLDTEYSYTPAELAAKNMTDDDGGRGFYLSNGDAEKVFKAAVRKARLRSSQELVGMRVTAKRLGKFKRGQGEAWAYEIVLSK